MTEDRDIEELSRAECIQLLGERGVGRIAMLVDDRAPLIVPVNYAVDGDVVVFRTGPGEKLAGVRTQPVSFEADHHDSYRRTGWSVLVRGVAYEIDEDHAGAIPEPWAPGDKSHWVRIEPIEITGRRVSWSSDDLDAHGYL